MKKHWRINSLSSQWVALAVIALFGVVIYGNIYKAPFVFDDLHQIEENVKIRDLGKCFSPRQLFSPRPIVELAFALNYKFGGLNVFGYHVVNALIHIINGVLIYFLALTIFKQLLNPSAQRFGHSNDPNSKTQGPKSEIQGSQPAVFQSTIDNQQLAIFLMSLFAALIFVTHPIQTQAVTYTAQRYTSMATMFYFLSIFCYMKGRVVSESSKLKAQGLGSSSLSAFSFQLLALYLLCVLCGVLAFFSKQNTASLPAVILLVEYLLFDRTWEGWKRKLLWFAPLFVLMGVFILYVSGIFREGVQFENLLEDVSGILRAPATDVGRWTYFCTQLNVIIIYIRLLFLPFGQSLDYMYPFKTGFFDGYTPVAFLFLMAVVAIGVWNIRKRPVISFGIFWFFITLSIESSFFPIKDALFEHRLYLPMFGFAIAVTYIVFCLLPVKRLWSIVLSILIIISIGSATFMRNRTYRDKITLWSDVVSKSPENSRAHYNLGTALSDQGRLPEAIESYFKTLSIRPDWDKAHVNLGVALRSAGRLDEAIRHSSERLRITPRNPEIHSNLGVALMQKGDLKTAGDHFSEALRLKPDFVEARNNLGSISARQGNLKDAASHFSEALRVEPNNAKINYNLGQALMLQGALQASALSFSEAVRIKPDYAEAHSKLGIVLTRQGDFEGGIKHFAEALKIKQDLNEARKGMIWARRMKGMKGLPNRR